LRRLPLAVAALIALTVLAVYGRGVARYASLGDDAFISFRYARHLADGLGLVFNPGERVEGYTNFLWVVMLALGMRLGLAPELLSNLVGVASGALVLAALFLLPGGRGPRELLGWLAPAALALSRTFTAWSTGGLETQLFTLAVIAALLALLREPDTARWPVSAWLFALATLVRPEGALFAGVALLFLAADAVRGRLVRLVRFGVVYGGIVGAHLLWRHHYYGFWLPNTFYAKVPGLWLEQGWAYVRLFHDDYRIGWLLPLMALPVVRRRERTPRVLAAVVLAQLAYVVAIGGDRFEFRFFVVILPYVYWLIAEGIHELPGPWFRAALAGLVLVATQLGSARPEARVTRIGVASVQDCKRYGARRQADGQALRALIDRGILPRGLRIAVGGAGALPYYTDWYTVDVFGLNDVRVAHQPVERRTVPGHERVAPAAYLAEKQVGLWDVLDGPLLPPDTDVLWQRVENADYRGPIRCLELAGRYLVFATTLPEAAHRALFRDLAACPADGRRLDDRGAGG